MKKCKNCGGPIGAARLKANPDAEICAKCIMNARGKEYDETFDDIEVLEVPEELKQKLRNRSAKINQEKESWEKEKEQSQIKFQEKFIHEKEELLEKQRQVEQENSELLSMLKNLKKELNRCVLNKEELVEKLVQAEQEYSELLSMLKNIKKELNRYVLQNKLSNLQKNQIILYENPNRYTQKSPLLVGRAVIETNTYTLAAWSNVDDKGKRYWSGYLNSPAIWSNVSVKGQRYWSGYLNEPNEHKDGKSSNRRIWFEKKSENFIGQISFGFVDYDIKLKLCTHPTTQFQYLEGEIRPMAQKQFGKR